MNSDWKNIRNKLRHSRAFIFALIAVFAVWLIANMSERKTYREEYTVCYDGLDTAMMAAIRQDSVIAVDFSSNGFHTFWRNLKGLRPIHIDISKELEDGRWRMEDGRWRIELDVNQLIDSIKAQIDTYGTDEVAPVTQRLQLNITQREKKAFVPRIDEVEFQFEGMHGICGTPEISPDTVWLYGSRASLDKISELHVAKQTIKHIFRSDKYKVRLEPVWKEYGDLRASTEKIEIYVPVETFIEKRIDVPIEYITNEKTDRVNLYPPKVTVTLLVPRNEYGQIGEKDISVIASRESDTCSTISPSVSIFPANVRVKSIEPAKVWYTVIR